MRLSQWLAAIILVLLCSACGGKKDHHTYKLTADQEKSWEAVTSAPMTPAQALPPTNVGQRAAAVGAVAKQEAKDAGRTIRDNAADAMEAIMAFLFVVAIVAIVTGRVFGRAQRLVEAAGMGVMAYLFHWKGVDVAALLMGAAGVGSSIAFLFGRGKDSTEEGLAPFVTGGAIVVARLLVIAVAIIATVRGANPFIVFGAAALFITAAFTQRRKISSH